MLLSKVIFPSLISAFGWGLCPIFHKLNMDTLNNNYIVAFALHCIFIGLISILLCLGFLAKFNNITKHPKLGRILILGFLGAFASTILGYYFYFKAMAQSKSTLLVVLIVYIIPLIVSGLVSYFYLGEKLNLGMIIGLLISMLGVCVFAYYSK